MHTLTFDTLPIDTDLLGELRSDHAGEYGAVMIYHGILAVSRSPEVRRFARTHLATEQQHLAFMNDFLPRRHRTRLLPLWRVMGWTLGALPALFGAKAVFVTIEAVERFVEEHYQRQLDRLAGDRALQDLRATLARFCADEIEHKNDAAVRQQGSLGWSARIWAAIVGGGSKAAVLLARRI